MSHFAPLPRPEEFKAAMLTFFGKVPPQVKLAMAHGELLEILTLGDEPGPDWKQASR